MALRRQIQPLDSKRWSQHSGVTTPDTSMCATPPRNGRGRLSQPVVAEVICMTPSAQLDAPLRADTHGAPRGDVVVQRLLHENASLRDAFGEASRRLARIEDEKSRFFDEGIFDLVNSVCGQPASTGSIDDLVARLRQQWHTSSPPDASEAHSPAEGMMGPVLASSSDISLSLDAACSIGEDRRGAVELSGENAVLRRELEQASRVSEALEWQQRAAEDRTHDLEEERVRLVEHLRRGHGDPLPAAAHDPPAGTDEWLQDVTRFLQSDSELAEGQVRMGSPREFSMPAEFNVPTLAVVHADVSDDVEHRGAGASPPWTPEGSSWLAPRDLVPDANASAKTVEVAQLEALQIDEAW